MSKAAKMALAIINAATPGSHFAKVDWPTVQFAQFEHDEKYHREISRLSVPDRLRHMALHFAKYTGRLHDNPSDEIVAQTAVDTLIIAISCANILNYDLSESAKLKAREPIDFAEFLRLLTVAAGKMAGACERIDHLEDFPFRQAIKEQTEMIAGVAFRFISGGGADPLEAMTARLAPIKAKSIFHGKL